MKLNYIALLSQLSRKYNVSAMQFILVQQQHLNIIQLKQANWDTVYGHSAGHSAQRLISVWPGCSED